MTIKHPLKILLTLLLTFGLLGGGAVQAGESAIKTSLSNSEVETIVSMYTDGEYEDLEDGDFSFNLGETKVVLFHSGKSMQLYAGFKHDSSVHSMNKWNAEKRFSRAYIDDEDDPVVESDLDLEGGSSLGAVREFIDTFKLSVTAFRKHIDYDD